MKKFGKQKPEQAVFAPMNDDVIERMRMRVRQMRKLKSLAYDPRMIAIIDKVIAEGETDIAKLEAEREAKGSTKH